VRLWLCISCSGDTFATSRNVAARSRVETGSLTTRPASTLARITLLICIFMCILVFDANRLARAETSRKPT
jgi:hypothetical protein